jgi:hypothetical protein
LSHIVTIQTQIRDAHAVRAACQRLGLTQPMAGTHKMYSGQVAGLAVQLPKWVYPLVCQVDSGQLQFDNYHGRWGEQRYLDAFLQMYAIEKAKIEARRKGHSVTEQSLADGSIKLTIHVGGAA